VKPLGETLDEKAKVEELIPPGPPMPRILQILVAGYVLAMFVAILYFLVKLWPLGTTGTQEWTEFFWGGMTLATDVRLILIAALAGALGAYVHLATSFADYAGNERLTASWVWWYLLRPFIGMALAEIVYLAVRGGLFNTGASAPANVISPYGVAAITALTGLFSKQATDKLREVFETLFRTQQKVERKDSLSSTGTLVQDTTAESNKAQATSAGTSR
jgi:hypothetical protein